VNHLAAVDVAVSPADKFSEFLQTKGKRLTPERATIVEEVFASHEHFDKDELVERLSRRTDSRRVSRATIYRTLKQLEDAGLLRKVARTDGRDVFEHDYGYPQHDHLICERCGTLIEFHDESISAAIEAVAAEHGFRMERHTLEVHGQCAACCRARNLRHPKLKFL
jgi:Fur family ferric uptake transcriptional regulator